MSAPAPGMRVQARGRAGARKADRSRGSWETVTAALEQAVGPGRPAGAWTKYCCPVHEADGRPHKPSLIVKYLADAGRTKVQCRAGCDDLAVLDKVGLGLSDLYDKPITRTRGQARQPARVRQVSAADRAIDAAGLPLTQRKKDLGQQVSPWRQTAVYSYADRDGEVVGEVIREEARFAQGRDKTFHQRSWSHESGWAETGFAPIPFQLPSVLAAIESGRVIYVCEGEKDVLAAEAVGLTATTNAGGAGSWKPEHAAWLRGAGTVVIVADRDAPGYRRAEKVMASLTGLVQRVRVLQAATGKDLHDHLQAGHEIADLEPIPHLDPFTTRPPAPAIAPQSPTAETDVVSAVSSDQEGPSSMPDATTIHHDDSVDHVSGAWVAFMRLLMQYALTLAQRQVAAARAAALRAAAEDAAAKAKADAELAVKQAAAEARLRKLREKGFDRASRAEIAEAVADAAMWAPDSEVARESLIQLKAHVHTRFGIEIDATTGAVGTAVDAGAAPQLAAGLRDAEIARASQARVRDAQTRMVEMIAREELDQSVKEELYAEIAAWRADPSAQRLSQLSKKLADKGVGEQTVTRVRFVAAFLGTPDQQVPDSELGRVQAATATTQLRKLSECLVDPAEEAKPGIDKLFEEYQLRLASRHPDRPVGNRSLIEVTRAKLNAALKVLTPEDQAKARERGNAILQHPTKTFAPLWPEHVDRAELGAQVRMYAVLAPQADAAAVRANRIDDTAAAGMRKQAAAHRTAITDAITNGKGLHQLEKDQLNAVLRDVEAGKPLPQMLFADDVTAAAIDAERAGRLASNASAATRRQVELLMESNAVPRGTPRRTRNDITRVMDTQSAVAAGRASLGDYEQSGATAKLDSALAAAGVSKPMRDRIQAELYQGVGQAASMGKQAARIAERWEERREAVEATRSPEPPAYDSAARRAVFAANLERAGLDPDEVSQRLAADAGRARKAAQFLVKPGQPRRTAPGQGVQHTHHRGKGRGRDEGDLGR
ncbi:toprim domain-containing protein [Nocardia sp. NPDC127579]|uniref:toprim domain-containing protein n=1 Tax=Nocardia sp. NPDC127579 TaxID=3345402 RepID=UPI00362DF8CB